MTIYSFPFDTQPTTETQYSYIFRDIQQNGVCNSAGSSWLEVTIAPGAALTVNIAPGRGYIRGFMFSSDAIEPRALAAVAAGSGSQRIDTIALRLDPAANAVSLVVIQGTSTGAPTLTKTDTGIYEMPLADVTVLASGTLSVVDRRTFTGVPITAWHTSERQASPRRGQVAWNIDTGLFEWWNGATWQGLLPVDTGWQACTMKAPFNKSGNSILARRIGSEVYLRIIVTNISNTIDASDFVDMATLPAGFGMSPPVYTRLPLAGFPSTSANGEIIDIGAGGVTLRVARVGPANAGLYYNGSAWLVD